MAVECHRGPPGADAASGLFPACAARSSGASTRSPASIAASRWNGGSASICCISAPDRKAAARNSAACCASWSRVTICWTMPSASMPGVTWPPSAGGQDRRAQLEADCSFRPRLEIVKGRARVSRAGQVRLPRLGSLRGSAFPAIRGRTGYDCPAFLGCECRSAAESIFCIRQKDQPVRSQCRWTQPIIVAVGRHLQRRAAGHVPRRRIGAGAGPAAGPGAASACIGNHMQRCHITASVASISRVGVVTNAEAPRRAAAPIPDASMLRAALRSA